MNSTQDAGSEHGKGGKKTSTGRTILEYVVLAVVAIAVALLIQAFLVKPYRIPSESMENTLLIGDRVLVDRISWRFSDPSAADIVVFHPPFDGPVLIKRIIGMPGDEISLEDGAVYVNGKKLDEPYVRTVDGQAVPVGAVRQRAAVVAAEAVHGAGRQLLRDGRQPHRQRRQPRVRAGAARPAGGQGVRAVLAAGPHRRRRLERVGSGRDTSASPSTSRPPAPTAPPSPAPTRPAAAVSPARSPPRPSVSTTRRSTRPAAKPSPASTTPSASPGRGARRSTTRSCASRARSSSSLFSPATIDRDGLHRCNLRGLARAVERLDPRAGRRARGRLPRSRTALASTAPWSAATISRPPSPPPRSSPRSPATG